MRTTGLVALGGVLAVMGLIWTLQGLGHLEGSTMTGVEFWAVVGPIVGGVGVALMIVGLRPKH